MVLKWDNFVPLSLGTFDNIQGHFWLSQLGGMLLASSG